MKLKSLIFGLLNYSYRIGNPIWEHLWSYKRDYSGWYNSGADHNADAVFEKIYDTNFWGDGESQSGPGSTLNYTRPLRAHLPSLLSSLGVKSLLDAPCGDLNWVKHCNLSELDSYHGWDLVLNEAAQKNAVQMRMRLPHTIIEPNDMLEAELPSVDAWLCRDVLFHLSNDQVLRLLKKFAKSDISYLLTTHFKFLEENGVDINPGGFRFVDPTLPPYCLGLPKVVIPDFVAPFPPRYLGVWCREDVQRMLDMNAA